MNREGESGLSVAWFTSAFGDLFTKTGFLEADFGFFDLRGKTAGLQTLFSLFNRSLSTADVNILGLLSDLRHDRDLSRSDFGVTPEDRHMIRLITHTISKLADPKRGEEVAMAWQDTEFTFRARRDNFIHLLTQQLLLRSHHF